MKRIFVLILLLALCLSGCSKYAQRDILGKTLAQIEEQYGKFDVECDSFVATDGSRHDLAYGYMVKESHVGYLGTYLAEYFVIVFDKNQVAVACYEGYLARDGL